MLIGSTWLKEGDLMTFQISPMAHIGWKNPSFWPVLCSHSKTFSTHRCWGHYM